MLKIKIHIPSYFVLSTLDLDSDNLMRVFEYTQGKATLTKRLEKKVLSEVRKTKKVVYRFIENPTHSNYSKLIQDERIYNNSILGFKRKKCLDRIKEGTATKADYERLAMLIDNRIKRKEKEQKEEQQKDRYFR